MHARVRLYLVWLFVWAATLLVFVRAWDHEFLNFDDQVNITENPHLRPVSWSNLVYFWIQPYLQLYIPLTYNLWSVESLLSSALTGNPLEPRVFHIANLLLHMLCCGVVFSILRRLVQHDTAACIGALFFAFHPLHVESVAWVSETKGLLCGLLSTIAIWHYLEFQQSLTDDVRTGVAAACRYARGRPVMHYWLASCTYVLAMLAKPAAAAVPIMCFALSCGWLRRPILRTIVSLTPWFMVAAIAGYVTRAEQTGESFCTASELYLRPFVAGDALAFYAWKLLLPINLGPDYGRSLSRVTQEDWIYVTWLLPAGFACSLYWLHDPRRWFVATGVFVAGLLPVLGFVPFAFQAHSTVADRYAYLALLGPALAVAWLWLHYEGRRALLVSSVSLILLAVLSFNQVSHWHDDESLFRHALRVNPRSYIAHDLLGNVLAKRKEFPAAIDHYRRALRFNPNFANAHFNLGITLSDLGQLDEAKEHYQAAIRLRRNYADAYFNLGVVLAEQGDIAEAIQQYTRCIDVAPHYAKARANLGSMLLRLGRHETAIRQLRESLTIDRNDHVAQYNLAIALLEQGETKEAIPHLRIAARLMPDNLSITNNLAWLLATSHDSGVRQGAEAVGLAELACEATGNGTPTYLDTLAAYAEVGRLDDAVRTAQKAIDLAESQGQSALVEKIQSRLDLYQSNKPYRANPIVPISPDDRK